MGSTVVNAKLVVQRPKLKELTKLDTERPFKVMYKDREEIAILLSDVSSNYIYIWFSDVVRRAARDSSFANEAEFIDYLKVGENFTYTA